MSGPFFWPSRYTHKLICILRYFFGGNQAYVSLHSLSFRLLTPYLRLRQMTQSFESQLLIVKIIRKFMGKEFALSCAVEHLSHLIHYTSNRECCIYSVV